MYENTQLEKMFVRIIIEEIIKEIIRKKKTNDFKKIIISHRLMQFHIWLLLI